MSDFLDEQLSVALAASDGPWRECEHVEDGCGCGLIWAVDGRPVCAAPPRYPELDRPSDEARANSRFIATFDPPTVVDLIHRVLYHRQTLRQLFFISPLPKDLLSRLKKREPWLFKVAK